MNKHSIYLKGMSLALALGMVMTESVSAAVVINNGSQDLSTSSSTLLAQRRSRLGFRVGVRPSRQRTGGIARGPSVISDCNGESVTVTALLPQTNRQNQSVPDDKIEVEQTVSANPTVLVHITPTKAKNAEFTVLNETGEDIVHNEIVSLTHNSGVVSLKVTDKPLQAGQLYHWAFQISCGGTDGGDLMVDGWLQYNAPTGELANVEKQPEKDRPAIYAEKKIWTETVSSLAELRQRYPNDPEVAEDWQSLLESVGLGNIAQAQLIGSLPRE
ncbi:MAG TPA: hypothetical protein DEG17_02525 [Cyanobacteria bacterium UBA11149]|nr:hypothetical protein [Cyanobacteria bacterium UBA11367]HBE59661.1 hypothetical protein [Cyanobacteria bacterium UBA11366]HBK63145.1 hypothetical protein [Cyanobacteria bacterium UBA11166]HBR74384.1 hypothetical protein [Cyanobacteria bacterium UBA11159]HBS68413.1 hypothetical protein [Cyanobacteria bacterium UBA11153]HBW87782.1 hypothetical protein [Cyanobacteria bacterium UBA11149]HCA96047.1 hypothetical protein [Cyanobacteria bacterium UBA9226]